MRYVFYLKSIGNWVHRLYLTTIFEEIKEKGFKKVLETKNQSTNPHCGSGLGDTPGVSMEWGGRKVGDQRQRVSGSRGPCKCAAAFSACIILLYSRSYWCHVTPAGSSLETQSFLSYSGKGVAAAMEYGPARLHLYEEDVYVPCSCLWQTSFWLVLAIGYEQIVREFDSDSRSL